MQCLLSQKHSQKRASRLKKEKTHLITDVSLQDVEMTQLEKDSDLLSRDIEKSHWKTSIKIMCSVPETDICQLSLHIWNNCKP